jgi:hypothetical protein
MGIVLTCTLPTRTAGGGIGGGPEVADCPAPPHEVIAQIAQMKPLSINVWEMFFIDIIHS